MRKVFSVCILSIACSFSAAAFEPSLLFEMSTPLGQMVVYRLSFEEMRETAPLAKAIFVEAFSTTYTEYYRQSGSTDSIEQWLHLRPGLTLESWLNDVFDEEYEEYLAGSKAFLYLCNEKGSLLGWLSHGPVSENGELYLSQCSLEAGSRNHKIATTAFEKSFKQMYINQLFPGVKEIKLITRKINTIAQRLYLKVGFVMDNTIDPSVYGGSYDDHYIGLRMRLD